MSGEKIYELQPVMSDQGQIVGYNLYELAAQVFGAGGYPLSVPMPMTFVQRVADAASAKRVIEARRQVISLDKNGNRIEETTE